MARSVTSMTTSRGSPLLRPEDEGDSSAAGKDRAPPQVHRVNVACMNWGGVQEVSEQERQTLEKRLRIDVAATLKNRDVVGITGINKSWFEWLRLNFYIYAASEHDGVDCAFL